MSTQRLAQSRLAPVGPAGASPEVMSVAASALSLDDTDTPCDVVDALILPAFADAEGEVTVGFWYRSERRGPIRSARPVSAEPWAGIRPNYAAATAGAMDQLMTVTPDGLSSRLILLYGPPGTGKTTALRALAREWLPWCDTDCVLDPELLFAEPRYLMEVALGDDEDTERWRLLLLAGLSDDLAQR